MQVWIERDIERERAVRLQGLGPSPSGGKGPFVEEEGAQEREIGQEGTKAPSGHRKEPGRSEGQAEHPPP